MLLAGSVRLGAVLGRLSGLRPGHCLRRRSQPDSEAFTRAGAVPRPHRYRQERRQRQMRMPRWTSERPLATSQGANACLSIIRSRLGHTGASGYSWPLAVLARSVV